MIRIQKLGHIVLRVRDLDIAERFYAGVLGLKVTGRKPGAMTFLVCGEESHDLALMHLGPDAPGPEPNRVGLYHFAYRVESLQALKEAYHTLKEASAPIVGSADHGVSQGIYILDHDGDEIELYYEQPRSQWPDPEHPFALVQNRPLTLE